MYVKIADTPRTRAQRPIQVAPGLGNAAEGLLDPSADRNGSIRGAFGLTPDWTGSRWIESPVLRRRREKALVWAVFLLALASSFD